MSSKRRRATKAGPRAQPGDEPPAARPLPVAVLYRRCSVAELGFVTTEAVPDVSRIVGQERAVEAIELAVKMAAPGFNFFALGPAGIGKMTATRQYLGQQATGAPTPDDWCYVHNFDDPQRPRALRVPAGTGSALREAMAQLCLELQGAIPAAFESEAYRTRKDAAEAEFEQRRDSSLAELEERAQAANVAFVRTPLGFGFAPTRNGDVMPSDEFHRLPEADQERIRSDIARLETELQAALRQVPQWQRETRRALRDVERDVIQGAVDHLIDELRHRFATVGAVLEHLDRIEHDIVQRASEFLAAGTQSEGSAEPIAATASPGGLFRRYQVNLLVHHGGSDGAPIVIEDHPTYANLVGRTEYVAQMGTLATDFMLIRAGALHRASGGYLILEADKVLIEPYAWEELKRAVRTREVRVEPLGQSLGLLTTATLEPEPIPLDVKVALIGDRRLYYLLCAHDPEFLELFKVAADFEDEVDRVPENVALYAGFIATLARREGLRPLTAGAVGRMIEYLARIAEDSGRLSTHMGRLADLLREADHRAGRRDHSAVTASDVQRAIDARVRRSSRLHDRFLDEIQDSTIRIEVGGSVVGQVNALSVLQLGEERFGHPSRVTATARVGRGEVVDVEREVELGGPIHSKGVLILTGFLGGRFGLAPLSLHASLVFEQSYGGVEGDSASMAELSALMSAIGGIPIRQDLAVTGSVDQHGSMQAVGGVNEKIEGFFDVCATRGLTGSQGVVIPSANVRHLMLAARVRRAVRAGRFHVYEASNVDEAMRLMTGLPAGSPDPADRYPDDTVNGRVQAGLGHFAEIASRSALGKSTGARTPGGTASRHPAGPAGATRI